jgi:hypothetical protein
MAYEFCTSEEIAKTRMCPLSITQKPSPFSCGGSQCMAWRWVEEYVTSTAGQSVLSGDTHGYCGMAGQPWRKRVGRW